MAEKLGNPFKISELIETVNNLVDTTVDDSNLVHKTGDEIISGVKTFTGDGWITKIQNTNVTYNTAPSSDKGASIIFTDKNGTQMGCVETRRYSPNNTLVRFNVYSPNGNWASQPLGLMVDANDNLSTFAPTPTTSDNSTQIATTAFVKAQGYAVDSNVVHKTGDETITGFKTVENNIALKDTQGTIGTINQWAKRIQFTDSTGARIARLESRYVDATTLEMGMYASNGLESESGIYVRSNGITYAPTPDTSDNSTKIATTAWVKNQGYMSSGNIFPNGTWVPVGDDAYMGDANHSGAVCFKGNNDSTKLVLINRAQNVALGFYIDEGDNNALKLTSPTYSATAWGSVTAMMAQSLSGNGYVKFNHGLIIQWGYIQANNSALTVTLPTAFSSTNYGLCAMCNNGRAAFSDRQTASDFTLNASGGIYTTAFRWLAIGY